MIVFYTDFGVSDSYVGEMRLRVLRDFPNITCVDLCHSAPQFRIDLAAHHLSSLLPQIPPKSVVVGVVDPGVGTDSRNPVAINADGIWFVGPGNGLFDVISSRASQIEVYEITWEPDQLSHSFHGRDLFAPFAARIAAGINCSQDMNQIKKDYGHVKQDLHSVIYIDAFGNLITGIRGGSVADEVAFEVKGNEIHFAKTFGMVKKDKLFWYRNSAGLVEIAANSASAKTILGVDVGEIIR